MPGAPAPESEPTAKERELLAQLESVKQEAQRAREAAERERADRERADRERADREERERVAREKREAEEREAKRHAEVLAAQTAASTQIAALIAKQGEMFTSTLAALAKAQEAVRAEPVRAEPSRVDIPAAISAIGTGLITPMVGMLASRAGDEQRQRDREHKERLAEISSRAALAAAQQRGQDPQVTAMQASVEALKDAIKDLRRAPKDADKKEGFLDRLREFREMRKLLGMPDEGINAAVKEAEEDPTLAIVDKVAERLEGPLTMVGSYITKRMERSDDEAKNKQRKGGWVQNGTSFVPALRARLPSGAEIDVPDDCALLANGQMCHIAMLPQVMATASPQPPPVFAPVAPQPQFVGAYPQPQFPGFPPAPQFVAPAAPPPFAQPPFAQPQFVAPAAPPPFAQPQFVAPAAESVAPAFPEWSPAPTTGVAQAELPFAHAAAPDATAVSGGVTQVVTPVVSVVPIAGEGEGPPTPDVTQGDGSDGDDSVAPYVPPGTAAVAALPEPTPGLTPGP